MREEKLCLLQHQQQDSFDYSSQHYTLLHHQQPQCITNQPSLPHTSGTSVSAQLNSAHQQQLYDYQMDSTSYQMLPTTTNQIGCSSIASQVSSNTTTTDYHWLNHHEQRTTTTLCMMPNYSPNQTLSPTTNQPCIIPLSIATAPTVDQPSCEPHDYSTEPSSSGLIQDDFMANQPEPPNKIIQRVKANKKERRRTQSINQAFSELRRHIPDVPADTKLSKIKTLRLAISYISHLMSTLENDEKSSHQHQSVDQRTLVQGKSVSTNIRLTISNGAQKTYFTQQPIPAQGTPTIQASSTTLLAMNKVDRLQKDRKHRTGWPEIVWSLSSGLKKRLDPIHLST